MIYPTKESVLEKAQTVLHKTLRNVISGSEANVIEKQIEGYKSKRKGFLGELIEKYFFGINPGNISEPDFTAAAVELKTTPLKKHAKYRFVSKERLVFSMIDYDKVVNETWDSSSFLKKNRTLLLMFYLWIESQNILDYEFKFIHLLDLLKDISGEDSYQIQKDWEYIVAKIKRGEAHLLSEGDTYYLGACTKAANSRILRDQPKSRVLAKPRAFSLKQQYINYLIQTKFLGKKTGTESIFKKQRRLETVEEAVMAKFSVFLGKTDKEILTTLGQKLNRKSKSYKRLIANRILGVGTDSVEELEKANITMKAITLEPSGTLTESISFPAFDYRDLITQVWYDEEKEEMSDFHLQLEAKKFLFVIFQKKKDSKDIVFLKAMFWNFPIKDLPEARRVWEKSIDCINEGRYEDLPKIKDSPIAHVRPHGADSQDKIRTPQGSYEVKRCFWLNAKYIQQAIKNEGDQA